MSLILGERGVVRTREMEERDEIVAAHAGLAPLLARALARRLPPCFDVEDLEQAGYVGLIEAAGRAAAMEPERRRMYLKCRMRGAMLDSVKRAAYRDATHAPLLPEVDAASGQASPEALAMEAEVMGVVEAARQHLTDRQWEVIDCRYREGLTQRETGERLGGIQQPTVNQHERRGLTRIREAVERQPGRRAAEHRHRKPLRPPLAA